MCCKPSTPTPISRRAAVALPPPGLDLLIESPGEARLAKPGTGFAQAGRGEESGPDFGRPRYICEIGKPLGSDEASEKDEKTRQTRREAYRRQRLAAMIMKRERVARCHWDIADLSSGVEVHKGEKWAHYVGLQTCDSVWACPVCSARISEERRKELNTGLQMAREKGLITFLMTLTFRHGEAETLHETLSALKDSMKAFRNHRAWHRTKKAGMVGTIVATEMTHGGHGWHPHAHILVFWKGDQVEGADALAALREPWLASLAGQGRDGEGAAFDVQDGSAAGRYVAKWGVAEELTLGAKKGGKTGGRHPWQILDDSRHDPRSRALFFEYFKATKGRRALVWSNGLKALLAPPEAEDEGDGGDDDREDAEVIDAALIRLQRPEWKEARKRGQAPILEAGEHGGTAAIIALLTGPPTQQNPPQTAPITRGCRAGGGGGSGAELFPQIAAKFLRGPDGFCPTGERELDEREGGSAVVVIEPQQILGCDAALTVQREMKDAASAETCPASGVP